MTCSECGREEEGVFHAPIFCGTCVQKMLGYTVIVKKNGIPPFITFSKVLRAVLSDDCSEPKGKGRVDTKSIQKCAMCGCIHWIESGICPQCGEET